MAGLGDIVQKAFYLGVGLASFATEKAGVTLQELRAQAQKLADEMVARGEMTAEEARKYVDELVSQAQQADPTVSGSGDRDTQPHEPRRIEIIDEDDRSGESGENIDELRDELARLQEKLRQLKQ